jgi:hypothetical protein
VARKRDKLLNVRLTKEEDIELNELVSKSGFSKSEYMRKCLLGKKIVVIDGFKELTNEVKRVGINVNQIAKALNFGNIYDCKRELDEMQRELKEVWQSLNSFLQKVK